jgi:hypothetical protein
MRREASRASFLMCPFCVRVLSLDQTTLPMASALLDAAEVIGPRLARLPTPSCAGAGRVESFLRLPLSGLRDFSGDSFTGRGSLLSTDGT